MKILDKCTEEVGGSSPLGLAFTSRGREVYGERSQVKLGEVEPSPLGLAQNIFISVLQLIYRILVEVFLLT